MTLTATVTSEYGGATSGAVTFKANGVAIAGCESANLSSGQATCTTTALGLGANTLTAEYNGDANNLASVSVGLTQTVSQRTTVTDLSSSANPSRVNQSVIFTATVSTPYGTPTGTVVFKDGGVAIGGCEAASMEAGQAACATTGLEPGIHSITAEYSGGTNDKASVSGSLSQTVKDDTVTNLVSSDNPTTAGQPVTFTAAVATSYGTPTGTVIFKDGGAAISGCAAVSLSGELKAFCTTSGLLAGLRAITAEYNGDSLHSPSVSTGLVQTVNQRITSTLLESSSNPSEIGQPVTLTAKVSGPFGTPGGTVTFKDGGEAISGCESVSLNDGQAACQTAALTLGGHTLTTEYSGDGNDVASTSNELTQTVNQRITTTSLASSANPSEIGQPVTITASVVSPYGKPTGTVVFKESNVVFPGCESVDLSNGKATCTPASLALGGHAFTAEYSGDNADLVSASSTFTQTVNKANPVVALISSFNPSALEEAVTFTATVTSTYGGAPAGKVTFKDNGVVISGCKDVSLSSGHAACTTDALAADTRKISAEYSGDATHDSAASGLDQIIIAPNCVPASFTNKTTANGLGSNTVYDVFALSSKVYAASSGGLSVSGDSGNTFANKTTANGLGSNIVYDVAADGSAIYAATAGGLSTSMDGGSTFTNKTTADGLGSNNINGVFVDGGTLYAATDGGVSISTNGGAAFTNRTTANGLGSDIVYGVYASGGTVFAATHGGLSISTDGGNTFTNRTTADGMGSNRVYDVYAVGSTVYAGTSLGLSISTDGGITFSNHDPSNGVGGSVQGVVGSKITVWAATSGGLSISTNHGRAFVTQTTANGLGSNTVEGVYVTGGAIYAATDGGLSIGRCAPPITGVSALKQGSSIRVSWKMAYSPGVSGFYVYRRIQGGAFSILNADLIPTQNPGNSVDEVPYSLLDQQIQDGVTYEYQVKAVLTNGDSEWSDIVQVKSGWLSYLPILMR